jgi:hypothetical protein
MKISETASYSGISTSGKYDSGRKRNGRTTRSESPIDLPAEYLTDGRHGLRG